MLVGIDVATNNFNDKVGFYTDAGTTLRSGTGFLAINGQAYTVITPLGADENSTAATDLPGINGAPAAHYALDADTGAIIRNVYALVDVPDEHARSSWWVTEDGRAFLRYPGLGKAQAFSLR